MENTRLTKKVLDWDIKVNAEKNIITWSSEVKDIFERNNQMDMFRNIKSQDIRKICQLLMTSLNKKKSTKADK